MAKNTNVGEVIIYPWQGGLETVSVPGTITVGRLFDGDNFIVDINGSKKKIPGVTRQDTGGTALAPVGEAKGLFDFWRTSGAVKARETIAVASGKIYADGGDGIYIDITGSFSIAPEDNVSIETFFGLLVLAFETNPGNQVLKYDQSGTVQALGGNPPNGKYLRTWQNKLWIGGISGAPDRLVGSVNDDPEDWVVGNGAEYIDIDQGDQDPIGITGLMPPFYGRFMVGKRRSLYEIVPASTTFGVRVISSGGIGLLSHGSASSIENDVIFASEKGIHSIGMTDKFGEVESTYLSYPIQNYYLESLNYDRADNMRSIYVPELNSYLLAYTSVGYTTNNILLGYNIGKQEWFKADRNVSAFAKYSDPTDAFKTKVLLINDSGKVGVLDTRKSGRVVTWFDEQITMTLRTGAIYPMGPHKEVTFKRIRMFYKPQSVTNSKITIEYLVNGRYVSTLEFSQEPNSGALIGSSVIGVDYIGGGGTIIHSSRELKGVGSSIEFVVNHVPVADDDDCELFGIVIEYEFAGETFQTRSQ